MERETENILIIGNGFDLHHGMQTRYSDMIQFYISLKNQTCEHDIDSSITERVLQWTNNSFFDYFVSEYEYRKDVRNWIDLEHGVKSYINSMLLFFNEQNVMGTDGRIKQKIIIEYPLKEEDQLMLKKAHALGKVGNSKITIKPEFITFQGHYDIEEMINAFAKELDELESIITFYLKEVEPIIRDYDKYRKYSQIQEINPKHIVSFNYTDTICNIYNIDKKDVTYIHGDLNSQNVVLGYEDLDRKTDDLVFKKYYRRLIKKTAVINNTKFFNQDEYCNQIGNKVYLFGHSLDISDEDILKPILEEFDVVIFYKDDNEYAKKIRKLFIMLGKEQAIERLHDGKISFKRIES